MTRVITATALGALLIAGQAFAQTTPIKPPTTTAPQTPPKTAPAPAQTAPKPAPAAPTLPPFSAGSKWAVVNFQYIANESNIGKAATAKMNQLKEKKTADGQKLSDDLKSLQDQQKNGAGVLADAALALLQQQIDRKQMDLNYYQQTAQKEVDDQNTLLMNDFYAKVIPAVTAVAKDLGVDVVLPAGENGSVVYYREGLDLSAEVVKKLNAAPGGGVQ